MIIITRVSNTKQYRESQSKRRKERKMRKTECIETENKILVDIVGLRAMLSVGRNSAHKIGEAAGAVVKVGRRNFYNVSKVNDYIRKVSGANINVRG